MKITTFQIQTANQCTVPVPSQEKRSVPVPLQKRHTVLPFLADGTG